MKTFNEIDEPFVCEKCGFHVERLGYSCRDHCPNCYTQNMLIKILAIEKINAKVS